MRHMGGIAAGSPFSETQETFRTPQKPSEWPLRLIWIASAIALVIAFFNNHVWSLIAYVLLLVTSFVLLVRYRMSLVRQTRMAAGSGAVLGIRPVEKVTIAGVIAAGIANGIVIGLWVGGFDLWFS